MSPLWGEVKSLWTGHLRKKDGTCLNAEAQLRHWQMIDNAAHQRQTGKKEKIHQPESMPLHIWSTGKLLSCLDSLWCMNHHIGHEGLRRSHFRGHVFPPQGSFQQTLWSQGKNDDNQVMEMLPSNSNWLTGRHIMLSAWNITENDPAEAD